MGEHSFEDVDVDLLADLEPSDYSLQIRTEKRRYDKPLTIVEGFPEGTNMNAVAKTLRQSLGAGGSVEEQTVELQGDHRNHVRQWLEAQGFSVE